MDDLVSFQSNIVSQSGEDGVIREICHRLPTTDRWCVEFGAWDGIHLSNVRRLITEESYSAVYIEGCPVKFEDLVSNYRDNDKVFTMNAFVGFDANDNLDHLLAKTPIPKDFDLLSIDIDGNDYNVWAAMKEYQPKVVCVEFNPTIPTHIDYAQPADPICHKGASLKALTRLGKEKGYELVCVLSWNAFFVKQEYFEAFGIQDNSVETLRRDESMITWIWTGFDGEVSVSGHQQLPWHGTPILQKHVQPLPWFLRHYRVRYNFLQKALFKIGKWLKLN